MGRQCIETFLRILGFGVKGHDDADAGRLS